jgi:hypothetical protein
MKNFIYVMISFVLIGILSSCTTNNYNMIIVDGDYMKEVKSDFKKLYSEKAASNIEALLAPATPVQCPLYRDLIQDKTKSEN